MRTVTSICFAAIAGTCLAFAILGLREGSITLVIPAVALGITALLLMGAWSMARQAGTPILLPLTVFAIFSGLFYWLLISSWE